MTVDEIVIIDMDKQAADMKAFADTVRLKEFLVRKVIDVTWGMALEDGSVPSTDIQNKIIARLNAQVTTTTVKSQDVREALATAQTEITRFRATARQDAALACRPQQGEKS